MTVYVKEKRRLRSSRLWLIAAAVIVGALLAFIALPLWLPSPSVYRSIAPVSDDEPVLVTGGSLTVGGGAHGKFTANGQQAIYDAGSGKITAVEFFYRNNAHLPAYAAPNWKAKSVIKIDYRDNNGNAVPAVMLRDSGGQTLTFDSVGGDTINSDGFEHKPPDGFIFSVNYDGVDYFCEAGKGKKGKCDIVLHFCRTCK